MKTIKQNTEVTFSAITLQEAIIVAPLMDELMKQINLEKSLEKYHSLPEEERERYCLPEQHRVEMSFKKAFDVLTQLGFCGTGNVDLLPEGYPLKKNTAITCKWNKDC